MRQQSLIRLVVTLLVVQVVYQVIVGYLPIYLNSANYSDSPLGNRNAVKQRNFSTTGNPQFVFLMGTEGSGHHLWSTLIEQSPNFERLKQLNLLGATEDIIYQLFSNLHLDESLFAGSPCRADWNGTLMIERTAQKLRFVADRLPHNMTVPLNGIPSTNGLSGMISYPNHGSKRKCAGFRHPDVRLLQQACLDAQVSCHFILQYRDPSATLRSTTINRNFHSTGYAIALYTAMFTTLTFQLSSITPSSLECCWYYGNSHPAAQLGNLLGYTNEEEFRKAFAQHYVPSNSPDVNKGVPQEHRVPFEGLLVAYNLLKLKCHEMVQSK
jgi:hypothetical protein